MMAEKGPNPPFFRHLDGTDLTPPKDAGRRERPIFFGMKRGGLSGAPPGKPREKTEMNRLKTLMLVAAVAALPLSAMAQAAPATPAQPSAGAPATPATPATPDSNAKPGKHKGADKSHGAHGQKSNGAKAKKPGDSSSLESNSSIQLAAAPFFKPVLGLGLN